MQVQHLVKKPETRKVDDVITADVFLLITYVLVFTYCAFGHVVLI